jgi:hypothetical protein
VHAQDIERRRGKAWIAATCLREAEAASLRRRQASSAMTIGKARESSGSIGI